MAFNSSAAYSIVQTDSGQELYEQGGTYYKRFSPYDEVSPPLQYNQSVDAALTNPGNATAIAAAALAGFESNSTQADALAAVIVDTGLVVDAASIFSGTNTWSGTNMFSNPITVPVGSAAAPGILFGANRVGFYSVGSQSLFLEISETNTHFWNTTSYEILKDNAVIIFGASEDTRLSRSAAGTFKVTTDGSTFGFLQAKIKTDTAYAAGSTGSPTGTLTFYDSTGTAYRVDCKV